MFSYDTPHLHRPVEIFRGLYSLRPGHRALPLLVLEGLVDDLFPRRLGLTLQGAPVSRDYEVVEDLRPGLANGVLDGEHGVRTHRLAGPGAGGRRVAGRAQVGPHPGVGVHRQGGLPGHHAGAIAAHRPRGRHIEHRVVDEAQGLVADRDVSAWPLHVGEDASDKFTHGHVRALKATNRQLRVVRADALQCQAEVAEADGQQLCDLV